MRRVPFPFLTEKMVVRGEAGRRKALGKSQRTSRERGGEEGVGRV